MKAKSIIKNGKQYIEIKLNSFDRQHNWNILVYEEGSNEPLEIQQEKKELADCIITSINKGDVPW